MTWFVTFTSRLGFYSWDTTKRRKFLSYLYYLRQNEIICCPPYLLIYFLINEWRLIPTWEVIPSMITVRPASIAISIFFLKFRSSYLRVVSVLSCILFSQVIPWTYGSINRMNDLVFSIIRALLIDKISSGNKFICHFLILNASPKSSDKLNSLLHGNPSSVKIFYHLRIIFYL